MVFDDDALEDVLIGGEITNGSYKPTDVSPGGTFAAPAPAPSGATTLATFDGTNPNGIWSLYVQDDAAGDGGSISTWSVRIVPESAAAGQGIAALLVLLAMRRQSTRTACGGVHVPFRIGSPGA